MAKKILEFVGSNKRLIVKEKQEMGAKNDEGNEKMSFEAHHQKCKLILTS